MGPKKTIKGLQICIIDRSRVVVLFWFSLLLVFAARFDSLLVQFGLLSGHLLGNSCPLG